MEELNQTSVNLNMTGFDLSSIDFSQLYNTSHFDKGHQIIFDTGEQVSLIGAYVMILVLGLTFNGAIIWVILARANNRTPRNLYTVNLAVSGILVGVFCVPTTMSNILYGGWWHFGVFACKLVPAIQGANILVSAFTITVIALDRWQSVTNTHPSDTLTYTKVGLVITAIWAISFALMTPLFMFQEVIPFDVAGQILGYFCKENFPNSFWNYSFTLMILLVQYLMPLMLLPIVHAKILIFLRKDSGFQNDSRRKEREIKRNKRMTKILSSISLIFAISWLPYHIYLILTDIFTLFQEKDQQETFYLVLGICHCIAMTSIFTNPLLYGWFNTSLRSELETLLPQKLRQWLHRRQDNLQKSTNGNHDIRISRPTEPLEPRPPQQDNGITALEMTPLVVKNSSTNLIPRREQADTESMKNMRNCENKRWQT